MEAKNKTLRWRAIAVALAATLFGSLLAAVAPSAQAAVGDLEYVQCIRDSGIPRDGCDIRPGLDGVSKTEISPDGRFLYAFSSKKIVVFARDGWGGLTWKACYTDGNENGCVDLVGIEPSIVDLVISPDGRNAYLAVSGLDHGITAYTRNVETGALTFVDCVEDDVNPSGGCEAAPALANVYGAGYIGEMAVTDAGDRTLYVTNMVTSAVVWFRRSSTDGSLSFMGCMGDSARQRIGNCGIVPGLTGPSAIAVPADGAAVYVGGYNTLLAFDRSATTGALTYEECFGNQPSAVDDTSEPPSNCEQRPGMRYVTDIALSADGKTLYTGSSGSETILHFLRVQNDADIAHYRCQRDIELPAQGCDPIIYVAGLSSIAVSSDGLSVFASGYDSDSLAFFSRDPNLGGRLTQRGCFTEVGTEDARCTDVQGLETATSVVVSPDANSVYVVGYADKAVTRFSRETAFNPPPFFDHVNPNTRITSRPAAETASHRARFTFTSNERNARFVCKLNRGAWRRCTSPRLYTELRAGAHTFQVAAIDSNGNRDQSPAVARWRIT